MSDTKDTKKPRGGSEIDTDSLASTTSVGPDTKEPKPSSAKTVGAKPAAARVAPYAVVGTGPTDSVKYSQAIPYTPTGTRKSLTVHHLQRRLAELGFHTAYADLDGRYGKLTEAAVKEYQDAREEPSTGVLTRAQFAAVFEGDPNVTVVQDTIADH